MPRLSIRPLVPIIAAVVLVIALISALSPSSARASHGNQSIFQDDDHLLYASDLTVAHTLDTLRALGVDRVRLTIQWSDIAPQPNSTTVPANFNATDPNEYANPRYGGNPGAWGPYDRVVEMAGARGIGVDFNVTAPGPLWAMQPAPVTTQYGTRPVNHYAPSAVMFGQFVQALGTRYSGSFVPSGASSARSAFAVPLLPSLSAHATSVPGALPRVSFWSIWNEPNQPGWLAPQWSNIGGHNVPESAVLYRSLLDDAVGGLYVTGHTFGSDTILIGETAPEGSASAIGSGKQIQYVNPTGFYNATPPMVFLRALYCVGSHYHPLSGTSATLLGCPASGSAAAFRNAHPGLFWSNGYAHHPYDFSFAPSVSLPDPDYAPLANLGRLERGLNRMLGAYGVHRKIPIYLTEYGYQTNPPDPNVVISTAQQAAYLNQADYMAWKDPRVRSMSQFLLYDTGPDAKYSPGDYNYWDTFQTGLIFGPGTSLNGRPKAAYAAYRLPIWLPSSTIRRGSKLLIWGMLRMAPKHKARTAYIRFAPGTSRRYRTIAKVRVPASSVNGSFTTRARVPGYGSVRIGWRSGPTLYVSRAAAFKIKR